MEFEQATTSLGSGGERVPQIGRAIPPKASTPLQAFARWLLDESGIDWLEPVYDQTRAPDEELSCEPVVGASLTRRAAE